MWSKRSLQVIAPIALVCFGHALTVPAAASLSRPSISRPFLGAWPPSLPFRVRVRGANPTANLDFLDVRDTGTEEEAASFVRLMDSEMDYLQRHPLREGPTNFWVVRKSTDVALHCQRQWDSRQGAWSFELAIQTLRTLSELVGLNGLKEFLFQVMGPGNVIYETCQMYLQNPHGGSPALADG